MRPERRKIPASTATANAAVPSTDCVPAALKPSLPHRLLRRVCCKHANLPVLFQVFASSIAPTARWWPTAFPFQLTSPPSDISSSSAHSKGGSPTFASTPYYHWDPCTDQTPRDIDLESSSYRTQECCTCMVLYLRFADLMWYIYIGLITPWSCRCSDIFI